MKNHGTITNALMVVLSLFLFGGCAPDPVKVADEGVVAAEFMTLESAYRQFESTNQKPPASAEDLAKFGVVEESLVSTRDGKPYKIFWGTSINDSDFDNPLIVAHEVDGKDGKKLALSSLGVMMLTEQEFAEARFPSSD